MKNRKIKNLKLFKFVTLLNLLLFLQNVNSQCWQSVSQSYFQTKAIKSDGTLWRWGNVNLNDGLLPGTQDLIPVKVNNETNWSLVSACWNYTIAIKTDGTMWSWGSHGGYGNLGQAQEIDLQQPTQIGNATNWKFVSAGRNIVVAIKTDGTLWGWSSYSNASFYFNSITNIPTQIGNGNNWKTVSCGDSHYVAIKTDGTLWSCGSNPFGGLGNNTINTVNILTQVGFDNNWDKISAGADYTLAIKNNGTLWAWGKNNFNQLGSSLIANNKIPTQIGADTNWKSINATSMGDHSIGLKTNGTFWAWGRNALGQFGDGTTTNRAVPTQIGNNSDWSLISGDSATFCIKSDNSMWVAGSNQLGQLGLCLPTYSFNYSFSKVSCNNIIIANNDIVNIQLENLSNANILSNDTYNSLPVDNSIVSISQINSSNSGISLNTTTGNISILSTVPIGMYTLTYKICSLACPSNCSTATVTVNVSCSLSLTVKFHYIVDGISFPFGFSLKA
jgi:alpha-tubulin suppressor-like RCC1 family protein